MMNWHQFDGGNPKPFEMFERRLRAHPQVGSALRFRNLRMLCGKALDVEFVDDGVAPGNSRGSVVSPLKRRIDHDAFWNHGGVAAIVAAQVFEPPPDPVAQ